MFDFEKVLDAFCLMAKLTREEAEEYHDVVHLSIEELQGKVKPDVTAGEYVRILTMLAAAGAYYRYMVMTNMTSGSIDALDLKVTVDCNKQIMAAKRLKDDFTVLAKNLLKDDAFVMQMI